MGPTINRTPRVPTAPVPSAPSGSSGDPHFKTWSHERYDFHGACDLVLLQAPDFGHGLGMDIHLRTKFTGQWSYIDTAVIKIGDDVLEVKGGRTKNRYWFNKKPLGDLDDGISGFPIVFKSVTSVVRQFTIELGGDEKIVVKTWKAFVAVDVLNGSEQNFGKSVGMMGTFGDGRRVGRDKVTVFTDANEFGQEWQVLASEPMLFHDVQGTQAPKRCAMPDTTQRKLRETVISQQDAETACARIVGQDHQDCIFDVLATGDTEAVQAYL